jgi:hypothetical protein
MKALISAVVVALTLGQAAQSRPDFSGRWTSDPEPAPAAPAGAAVPGGGRAGPGRGGAPADIGSGWGSTVTLTQNATQLVVEFAFFARGDLQPPVKFVYALDGSETTNTVMMGRGIQVQRSRARWNGDALVMTTAYGFADPQTGKPATAQVTRTLTLASPTSLVVDTVAEGVLGGPASTAKTSYRKLGQ